MTGRIMEKVEKDTVLFVFDWPVVPQTAHKIPISCAGKAGQKMYLLPLKLVSSFAQNTPKNPKELHTVSTTLPMACYCENCRSRKNNPIIYPILVFYIVSFIWQIFSETVFLTERKLILEVKQ